MLKAASLSAPLPTLPATIVDASEIAAMATAGVATPAPGPDLAALTPAVPDDAELVASLYMHHGVVVGAFILDLPKIRARLVETAAEAVRQSGATVQQLAVDSAYGATQLVKQAAWSTGEACVVGAWQMSTWPMRSAFQIARLCLGKTAPVR